jgi:hypothetical protein
MTASFRPPRLYPAGVPAHTRRWVGQSSAAEHRATLTHPGTIRERLDKDATAPAGFSDQATVGIVYALLTYILGFVALEIPRAGTDPQTSDEFVRRLQGFFAALPPGEFPHTVALAPLLARISTDDQFRSGISIFIAGLSAQRP